MNLHNYDLRLLSYSFPERYNSRNARIGNNATIKFSRNIKKLTEGFDYSKIKMFFERYKFEYFYSYKLNVLTITQIAKSGRSIKIKVG